MKVDLDNSINNIKIANDILSRGTGRISLGQLNSSKAPVKDAKVRIWPVLLVFISVVSLYVYFFNSSPFSSKALRPQSALANPGGSLLITSGHFISEKEARDYKAELKSRVGIDLKLLKIGDIYTVQVGPSYPTHEDALLVFDELSRYAVADLSLRFE